MVGTKNQQQPDGELVKKLISYLDNPEDQRGVWRGLHFMEANGLDFSLRYEELHGYLTNIYNSPLENPEQLSHEQERNIVLALRDVVRRDLGLPPLTEEEKHAWKYERQEPVEWRPDQLIPRVVADTYHPTPDDIAEIKSRISDEHPEVMRALALSSRHNIPVDGQRGKAHSTIWINHRLDKLVAGIRPELEAIGVHNCVHGLIKDIWETEREKFLSTGSKG
jgi:hypothetical protein